MTAESSTHTPTIWSRTGQFAPMVLTLGALGAALWWGHHVSWTAPNRTQLAAAHAHHEDWCAEHNVPESTCILCKKSLMKEAIAAEPEHYRAKDEDVRFAHAASAEAFTRAGVTTAQSTTKEVEPSLDAPAQTVYEPARVARVSVRLAGAVRWVGVRLGDRVDAGATIALVESIEVGAAKATLMRVLAEAQAATATRDRIAVSTEAGVRTKAELAEAEAKARTAQVAIFEAEQALLNLGFDIKATDLTALTPADQMARLRTLGLPVAASTAVRSANVLPIIAPRAGTVTELSAVDGATVEAGGLLAVIADTSELRVNLAVASSDAFLIAKGQLVRLRTADGVDAAGTIQAVAPEADANTRLVAVTATVANSEHRLRVNQVGTATVVLGAPQPAVVVPPSALQWDGTNAYVFIKRNPTTFRGLKVPVLARTPDGVAIGRLRAGEEIAMTGTAVLKAGIFHDRFGAGCTDD